MLCRAIPYEGQEPYIFLSYSHKDAPRVYPLLEQMVRDGYRIWYDDGNHPGDDWLENIAQHLNGCYVCLAMLSANTGASHNCRNEVNLAIELKKKLMAVQLEQFDMPLGMRLQLGTIHYLKQYEYPSAMMLLEKLYETAGMKECLAGAGTLPMRQLPEEQAPVQEEQKIDPVLAAFVNAEKRPAVMKTDIVPLPEEEAGEAEPVAEEPAQDVPAEAPAQDTPVVPEKKKKVKKVIAKVKKVAAQPEEPEQIPEPAPVVEEAPAEMPAPDEEEAPAPVVQEEPVAEEPAAEEPAVQEEPVAEELPAAPAQDVPAELFEEDTQDDPEEEKTVYIPQEPVLEEKIEDEDSTVRVNRQKAMALLRLAKGKGYVLQSALTRIGRSERRCDVVLADNASISNHHADIIQYNGHCYLRDAGSSNGTFVQGERLEQEGQIQLEDRSVFFLYNEPFVLLMGQTAEQLTREGKVFFLRSEKTQSVKLVGCEELLDRKHKWEDGTLDDLQISRVHARILLQEGVAFLEDRESTNGTYLNDRKLSAKERSVLKSGDQIRLGETVLVFGVAEL